MELSKYAWLHQAWGSRRRVVVAIEHEDKFFSLIRSALTGLGSGLELQRVTNGLDALRLFRKVSPYERVETPRLVIIDTASFVQDAASQSPQRD
jgi:hypothetical protein